MKKNKNILRKDKLKEDFYDVLTDINTRAAIAFGLALIALLLTYIAFK